MMKHIFSMLCIAAVAISSAWGQGRPMEIEDIMKFRQISDAEISDDGRWVVHAAVPDRGDPEVYVYSTDGKITYQLDQANNPVLSGDGNWVAMNRPVPALQLENAGEKAKDLKNGMVLLNTGTGEEKSMDSVQHFEFSNDSRYLFIHRHSKNRGEKGENKTGSVLQLFNLAQEQSDQEIPFVTNFAVDSTSRWLALIVSDTVSENNGVYMKDLSTLVSPESILLYDSTGWASNLLFSDRTGELAFLSGEKDSTDYKLNATLYSWREGIGHKQLLSDEDLDPGWKIFPANSLSWSDDGMYLFLGTKPEEEIIGPEPEQEDSVSNLYGIDDLLDKREVDVWHWDDPYINSHQKLQWRNEKDRTYTGVYHLGSGQFVQLASKALPEVRPPKEGLYALGYSDIPYRKRVTWDGSYNDLYLVNLESGSSKLVVGELQGRASLSPDGKHLVYYKERNWFLVNSSDGASSCLTENIGVPFADEDWDYPESTPGYGVAGWINQSDAVMIYDKYDIWMFPTDGSEATCLTEGNGRNMKYMFRIQNLEAERAFYTKGEEVFLSAYHDIEKHTAVYRLTIGIGGLEKVMEEKARYSLLAKAKHAENILFTRQSYTEYPDLQVTGTGFKKAVTLSDLGKQTEGIAWGEPELIEWSSTDGRKIQGVLIKPGNYQPGKKYPVLVYYYRFYSNRMYEFPAIAVNHRPCFPYYASNDYAVFLPDIRFDIGIPGPSATKCLVPGVQKLIDMGIADPDAIALHGHSWSGYQTAFVITQTDIFACAIAGAPVSNMTSAYSGIRWESGLARQFQYEKTQSRIGGSLWEARDKYIENSPVFFADRIETPLLIQFGDEDGAVPWYQGIELYLAMRRLEKDCIFLQYRGEPHHLGKYPNKLDYTIKFKQYLDHYCKGEEAADWIRDGVLYDGT